ncbi:LysE family translocator [Schlegelella sp. S2-27]|uniref:LysE family translocator n=1 Tax=Caldimonas mangrovi TaxID=2944811 RepID=A0ABT0YSE9_9BURK|nr:LysE family translocator [Caldimonas mangrovi]MCM5681657.1 LysE family translocator [Caldimonas mangrovi]
MIDVLPPWPLLGAFLLASLLLAVTPGPAVVYLLTRTLAQGRRAGLASVVGVALGNLGNAVGAAIGLAALFAVSSLAFTVVKYAGAAYLVYLGVQALRSAQAVPQQQAQTPPATMKTVFRDGFLVALLNPKTALFFAAFLPQFTSAAHSPLLQSATLGAVFVAVAATTDVFYVLMASLVAGRVRRMGRARLWGRYATAGAFIGLGAYTALSGSRGKA